MANAFTASVIFVDTTGYTNSGPLNICGIKYIGNTNGTATITSGTSGSGDPIWKESGTSNQWNDVEIRAKDGIHVAVTNSAQVYIYLR